MLYQNFQNDTVLSVYCPLIFLDLFYVTYFAVLKSSNCQHYYIAYVSSTISIITCMCSQIHFIHLDSHKETLQDLQKMMTAVQPTQEAFCFLENIIQKYV